MWGECWEIKENIGETKISGGQKCKKRGGKTFLGECWGSCEPQQILGGEFLEKCQRKKCDAVGMVRKFSPQKIRGLF